MIGRLAGRYRPHSAVVIFGAAVDGLVVWALATPTGAVAVPTAVHDPEVLAEHVSAAVRVAVPRGRVSLWCSGGQLARQVAARLRPELSSDDLQTSWRALEVRARSMVQAFSLLRGSPSWVDPGGSHDPYTVATDGSAVGDRAGYGFVTGAGWCGSGAVAGTINVAEFSAYAEALALYPDGSVVTVVTDSVAAGQVLQEIAEGAAAADITATWLPQRLVQSVVVNVRRLGAVRVQWHRRNKHPLQRTADHLARQAVSGTASEWARGVASRVTKADDTFPRKATPSPTATPTTQQLDLLTHRHKILAVRIAAALSEVGQLTRTDVAQLSADLWTHGSPRKQTARRTAVLVAMRDAGLLTFTEQAVSTANTAILSKWYAANRRLDPRIEAEARPRPGLAGQKLVFAVRLAGRLAEADRISSVEMVRLSAGLWTEMPTADRSRNRLRVLTTMQNAGLLIHARDWVSATDPARLREWHHAWRTDTSATGHIESPESWS